jgi:iron complex outermembrane receptor protein
MRAIIIALGLLCLILVPQSTIFAQSSTGIIKGQVATAEGEPAASVGVRLKDTRRQTLSDDKGGFIFRNLKPGTYELEVFLFDHDKYTQTVTVKAGETTSVDVKMTLSQKTLREVVIAGDRNKFARKESESAVRMPLKNIENPQVYTVVPAELMREQVILDYKDAIKNVAGVNSTETVSNGRTSAIIRGFRTGSFVRNGLVANQLITVDPANLERIEVIKGPSGTLFGSGAVSYGGLVNRVTKRPFESFKTELALTAGSFGLNRITADINAPLNDDKSVLLRVNAGRHAAQSFQESGFKQNYFLAAALTYKANEKLTFLFDLELFRNYGTSSVAYLNPDASIKTYKDMEQFYYKTFYSNDLTSIFPGYNVYAQMNYKINSKWNTTTLFSTGGVNARNQLQFSGTLYGAASDSLTRKVQKYSHNYQSINVQQNINGEFNTGSIRHRVLIGADYLADITQPTFLMNFMYDTINIKNGSSPIMLAEKIDRRLSETPLASHYQSQIDRYGIYAADVINFTDRLLFMMSLRWDKVDNKGTYSFVNGKTTGAYSKTSLSPKFGVVYQVMKEQLSVFANYMNGFSYSGQPDRNGNIFKPEQANQWEGGVKAEMFSGKLNATLSYYDITVSDKLRTDPADNAFQIQDGKQKSKGFEVELITNPIPGLNILAGYGFNESEIVRATNFSGKRPARSGGKHMGNAWVSYRLPAGKAQGLGIAGGVFYNSETVFNDANTLFFPAYALVNGTVFYDRPGYRIGVKLDNITNTKYWGPWGEPQPPRNYAVNLILKF